MPASVLSIGDFRANQLFRGGGVGWWGERGALVKYAHSIGLCRIDVPGSRFAVNSKVDSPGGCVISPCQRGSSSTAAGCQRSRVQRCRSVPPQRSPGWVVGWRIIASVSSMLLFLGFLGDWGIGLYPALRDYIRGRRGFHEDRAIDNF